MQSVITSPGHDEIIPLTQEKYTVKGYAYSGELACQGIRGVMQGLGRMQLCCRAAMAGIAAPVAHEMNVTLAAPATCGLPSCQG